ncbi:MAG TPA: HAMP domain-containing sensor histidine kinase [Anaerolineae bacterium]|nr:HAMP domain-containing sensor histidine kinase [Anaerolineae bacterium]HQI84326.1 HAMP domain-containing sensor histidine kinase [Anaerolineae bacterium]
MSIRLRLTLLYSLILALTLMIFSAVLYAAQSQYTLNMVRNDLAKSVEPMASGIARAQNDFGWPMPFPWIIQREGPEGERARNVLQPLVRERRPRDVIHIRDAEGNALALSSNDEALELPLSQEGLSHLKNGEVWEEFAHDEEGRLFIYNQPVMVNNQFVGVVQIARSLADRDRSLRSLGITLLAGSALTTLIAFGIGWTLSGVTLRPIQRITETAREIGASRDFSSRVEHKGPNDELGRLATTFNTMLGHLQDAYQRVARALQVQRDFVADVSHELRTPLTTIRGNLTLLQRKPPLPRDEQEDILNDLIGESERLSRLVTDLLILARADAGRKLDLAPVPLEPLVDDVCRQARLLAPERDIICTNDGALTVQANEDALKQVLLILLDNAIKHGKGAIHVVVEDHDQQANVRVQDDGPGMSPEMQQRLFDRFHRGDASRSTPGFGLGLSIARALTESQQGTITVESDLGRGSAFTIALAKG